MENDDSPIWKIIAGVIIAVSCIFVVGALAITTYIAVGPQTIDDLPEGLVIWLGLFWLPLVAFVILWANEASKR